MRERREGIKGRERQCREDGSDGGGGDNIRGKSRRESVHKT